MSQFSKQLCILLICIVGFTSVTLALSMSVTYKPWGVPDSRREDYDRNLVRLTRESEVRKQMRNRPTPRIQLGTSSLEFGWVSPLESLQQEFSIQNTGDAELELHVASTSRESVRATLDTNVLDPGETTTCVVELIARDEWSKEQRVDWLTIATNVPLQPTIRATLQHQVKRQLVVPESFSAGKHDLTEPPELTFSIYSQLAKKISVIDISSDDFAVQWSAEATNVMDDPMAGRAATTASRVIVKAFPTEYGKYSGKLKVQVDVDGETQLAEGNLVGRVRSPVGFYGPNVDMHLGVDFGTLESGQRHDMFVTVRSLADPSREIAVLDVEPKALETEFVPTKTKGSYRLRISVPADCENLQFNLNQKRGYVQVGDPQGTSYSAWLPVYGVIARTKP